MKRTAVGLYGASGFGREVMPLLRAQSAALVAGGALLLFIDDKRAGETVNGCQVVTYCEFMALDVETRMANVAIADGTVRKTLFAKLRADDVAIVAITAPGVVIGDGVAIGAGAILCSSAILTSNITVGEGFHANLASYVAHDCIVGDFVTFAPGVKCNGNVTIADLAYVGTGAILKQGRPDAPLVIGAAATVGMGAVVTRDVAPGTVVVGNPAREMAAKPG